jgi:endonuclease/exonuclease/phosphatase family metal-dependent hydrolase
MSFDANLIRKGPGLLVRDLMRGKDKQIAAVIAQITRLSPDILALQSVDYDYDHVAIGLLKEALAAAGQAMPHHYSAAPNTGVPTGFDLDRNDRLGEARDAQGYGVFRGQGGMVLLSRFPVLTQRVQDFTASIWAEIPNAQMPNEYFLQEEADILRLHSVGAWDVPVRTPEGVVHVLMSKAGPPVFDGPEDRNGLRNADEIGFWERHIERSEGAFVIMAGLNNDPVLGEGLKPDLLRLLSSDKLIDPQPRSKEYGSATVNWDFGKLRVDYILPSATFGVKASGVEWLATEPDATYGSRHRPVWVDIFWK